MENMTISNFFDEYDRVRRNKVKNAPAINNRKLTRTNSWSNEYYIRFDVARETRLNIYCNIDGKISLDVPIDRITIMYNSKTKAIAQACVTIFSKDMNLPEKMTEYYKENSCETNDLYAAYLTKDGYLILYGENDNGSNNLKIYYVIPY